MKSDDLVLLQEAIKKLNEYINKLLFQKEAITIVFNNKVNEYTKLNSMLVNLKQQKNIWDIFQNKKKIYDRKQILFIITLFLAIITAIISLYIFHPVILSVSLITILGTIYYKIGPLNELKNSLKENKVVCVYDEEIDELEYIINYLENDYNNAKQKLKYVTEEINTAKEYLVILEKYKENQLSAKQKLLQHLDERPLKRMRIKGENND